VAVKTLLGLAEEHSLKTYTDLGRMYANWVRGKQGELGAAVLEFKEALASYLAQGFMRHSSI
jgi:hypothetical protein